MSVAGTGNVAAERAWTGPVCAATRLQVVAVALLLCIIYLDPIRSIVARWMTDPNWSHGWLIPVFSLYFLWLGRGELRTVEPQPNWLGAIVLGASLTGNFFFAWIVPMTYPQALTLFGSIYGAMLLLGGWPLIRAVWFSVFFLVLAVPLPQRTYVEITQPLREIASKVSAAVLPFLVPGLHADAQAVVIDYMLPGGKTGQLNVEEACSGMRLMMAFVTLGLAMAYLGQRPLWQRLFMVGCCVPIAVFCNAVRVTLTGYFTVTGHTSLAQGTPHELLGIAMLLLALALYAAIGYVLSHLWVEVEDQGILHAEG